jgi:putative Mg2+ transporter-C (MgtC) family protein
MSNDYAEIFLRLMGALFAGGMIGLERSYHGRPAGFRTHALVCLASSLLMLVTVYEGQWFSPHGPERVSIDPTRMSQGIMTGIGFLGAGVIMIEGLSVRGLTTAASIWITAAIGILMGIGFYFPATVATALTLGTLSLFRWIETRIPSQFHAHFLLRFEREAALPEPQVRALVARHGFTIANLSYRLNRHDRFFEYRMVIRSRNSSSAQAMMETLNQLDSVIEFRISPTGD